YERRASWGKVAAPGSTQATFHTAMTANLAVWDGDDSDRWGAGPPKWAVPFSCIVTSRMVTEAAVLQALRAVRDPASQQDTVALGLARDTATADGEVPPTWACAPQPPATRATLHGQATKAVRQLPGVSHVQATLGRAGAAPAAHAHAHQHGAGPVAAPQPPADLIPEVRHTIAVSSGKGGVGKSTVAVNLAVALKGSQGAVGIIDADVSGPDVPMMLGSKGRPGMFDNKIIPVESHGLKMMSIGLLVNEREPLVWRGPMIHSFIQQMLRDVMWGALDY